MMKRKTFLKISGSMLLTSLSLPVLQGCTSLRYVNATKNDDIITVNKSDLDINEKYVLLSLPDSRYPLFLGRTNSTFYALSLKCTHMGCIVELMSNKLICPCHGSEFSLMGEVLKQPSDTDLTSYLVTVDERTITINLKN